jgi:glycosyltransferase involved in cell wall biosynthesis
VESGTHATLEIRGPSLNADERAHREELAARIAGDERLQSRVELLEPVARSEIPALLASIDVLVSPNEPRSGSTFDKVVFEAAACARPVVSTNAAFAPLLEGLPLQLLAAPGDPAALAAALRGVAAGGDELRAATGAELRRRVVERHSLDHWVETVIAVMGEIGSRRG